MFCGAALDEASGRCTVCHDEAPARATAGTETLGPCPRCQIDLAPVRLERAVAMKCAQCGGCFLSPADWDVVLERELSHEDAGLGQLVPPPPGSGPSPAALFAIARCPRCLQAMERAEFAARSHVTLDICRMHGIWFDAGELVRAVHYVQSRAEADAQAAAVLPPWQATEDRQYREAMARATTSVEEANRNAQPARREYEGLGPILTDLLGALLSGDKGW